MAAGHVSLLQDRLQATRETIHDDAGRERVRPLYNEMKKRLAEGGADNGDVFANFVPSFFETLRYYFPSRSSAADDGRAEASIGSDLPRPPKVTLVLRTFGTDLPLVARCISEFARGNHPRHGDYVNRDLILDGDDLFRSSWSYRDVDDAEKKELVYGLHRSSSNDEGESRVADHIVGDVEVLDLLQSRTVVGIQDNYPFWRDHNHEPWSGKPVWVTSASGGRYDHHHVLLDDNIHNDPADGAGGIRVEDRDDSGGSSFRSLPGEEALGLHGVHLIRVLTVRPVMEDGWFIRQIEGARMRHLDGFPS